MALCSGEEWPLRFRVSGFSVQDGANERELREFGDVHTRAPSGLCEKSWDGGVYPRAGCPLHIVGKEHLERTRFIGKPRRRFIYRGFHYLVFTGCPVGGFLTLQHTVRMLKSVMNTDLLFTGNILIIGYGSPLRGDDAAGYLLASEWQDEPMNGITCIAAHQLTPDLAETISRASEVIFVDSFPADRDDEPLRYVTLSPSNEATDVEQTSRMASHASSPAALLDLAETLFHHRPPAMLLGIPAFDFSLGENISDSTRARLAEAKIYLQQRITNHA